MSTQTDSELREKVRKLLPTLEYETGRGWRNVSDFIDKLAELIEADRRKSVAQAVKLERLKFLTTLDERGLLNDKGKLKLIELSRPNSKEA